jgi:hypothetical protein
MSSRSQWSHGLRHRTATARLLGLWVGIPQEHGYLSFASAVCCQVEASVSGRSLVQRSPTECGVSEYDHESSIMRRPWPTRDCCAMGKKLMSYWFIISSTLRSFRYNIRPLGFISYLFTSTLFTKLPGNHRTNFNVSKKKLISVRIANGNPAKDKCINWNLPKNGQLRNI